jgi:hypothetical protein
MLEYTTEHLSTLDALVISTMSKTSEPVKDTVTQISIDTTNIDDAWTFLNIHNDTNIETSSVDIDNLRRRIDWRIVPILFCCYTMQFLDKVILNYAAVMGLQKDLNLRGNDFTNVATFLSVGFLCFEILNSMCISRSLIKNLIEFQFTFSRWYQPLNGLD